MIMSFIAYAWEANLDYQGMSTNGLLALHGAIRNCLDADDNTPVGQSKLYGVRTFPDWRRMADDLENELKKRNARYQPIIW